MYLLTLSLCKKENAVDFDNSKRACIVELLK